MASMICIFMMMVIRVILMLMMIMMTKSIRLEGMGPLGCMQCQLWWGNTG